MIQEQSPYGVTAVGQVTVTSTSASFGFRAFNGVTGLAVLQFAADGTVQATFTNSLGQSSQATLTPPNY